MEDILKQLFYGELKEAERPMGSLQKTKEFARLDEAYNALQEALSEQQRELFDRYYSAHATFASLENERFYTNGIKTGMQLVISAIHFQP